MVGGEGADVWGATAVREPAMRVLMSHYSPVHVSETLEGIHVKADHQAQRFPKSRPLSFPAGSLTNEVTF